MGWSDQTAAGRDQSPSLLGTAPFAVDLNSNSLRLPGVTDNQSAIGGLTQGTNLRVGREGQANRSEGQANRSHECQSDSNHSILLPLVEYRAS